MINTTTPLPFSSVTLGSRLRTEITDVESLSESILDAGLIQPIILDPEGNLIAGGRRYAALKLLIENGDLPPFLYHATTSDPTKPGYLLRGETSMLDSMVLELKENLDREDVSWRDIIVHLVKTYKLAQEQALDNGDSINIKEFSMKLSRDFGASMGYSCGDLVQAMLIEKDMRKNPDLYKDCTNIRAAYSVYIKETSKSLAKLSLARHISTRVVMPVGATILPSVPKTPRRELTLELPQTPTIVEEATAEVLSPIQIDLSSSFFNMNGLDFMEAQIPAFCNHVICDPDYAVAAEILNSNPNNRDGIMEDGVAQESVEKSLADLYRLIPLAFRAMTTHGFFVFWYSLDHHEKLQEACKAAGFRVQPWPLIWNKTDFRGRSNAAPNHNFPKSVEYAMVCRKPNTVLTKVQNSCLYTHNSPGLTKELNHAYAKPFEVWSWIYRAVTIKGQIVFDPFVGSGSSAIAALMNGLNPIGTEISENHYADLIINLHNHYPRILGPNIQFI